MATSDSCRASKLAARARKRKSRAKPKPVIKQLLAHDPPSFKDLVQEYTGGSSSSLSSAAAAQYSASSANTSHAEKTPANSCWVGDGAAALQMSHEDLMVQGSEACSHVDEWSCGGYGSPAGNCTDEQGKCGLSQNPAMLASAYIAQSLKALGAISSSCASPSPPPFEEAACMPMMRDKFVSTGAMINAHLAKLLEHNISRGNHMTSCRDQLHTLSLSCLLLMLNQMTSKAVGEGLQ